MVLANYHKVAVSSERAGSISSKKEAGSVITDLLAAMGVVDEAELEFSKSELAEFKQLHSDNQTDDIKDLVSNRILYMLYFDVWNEVCSVDSNLLDVCPGLRLLEMLMPEFKHSKLVQVVEYFSHCPRFLTTDSHESRAVLLQVCELAMLSHVKSGGKELVLPTVAEF